MTLAVSFVAFPASSGRDAGALDRYTHLLGYALGFLVPIVTTTMRRSVARHARS